MVCLLRAKGRDEHAVLQTDMRNGAKYLTASSGILSGRFGRASPGANCAAPEGI